MTEPAGPQLVPTSSHRWRATVFFGLAALVWTIWLGAIVSFSSNHELYVFLWCGSAVALWFLLLGEMQDTARPALRVAFKWWVLSIGGPIGLAYVFYVRKNSVPASPAVPPAPRATRQPPHLPTPGGLPPRRLAGPHTDGGKRPADPDGGPRPAGRPRP